MPARLSTKAVLGYLADLPGWELGPGDKSLWKRYALEDFKEAVRLFNEIARIAEAEDHHPNLHLTGYRNLAVELSTHSVGGLSENDVFLALKIEVLPKK